MRDQTCCFSGHRTIREDQRNAVTAQTEIIIRDLIVKRNIRFFGVGGALGYDYLGTILLLRLRETVFPHIKVILIYPFEGYQSKWTKEQKDMYAQIWDKFDKRVCVSEVGNNEAFLARNRHMVNHSSVLVCYYDQHRSRSGTAQCVRYAQRQGLEIFNVALGSSFVEADKSDIL